MIQQSYVLVTPVRNEERTIGETIRSVLSQTVIPKEWVIVSDGSDDATDSIVESFIAENAWIRLLRLSGRPERSFASVVFAAEAGCRILKSTEYKFVGLLDADVRLPRDYFERVIARFMSDSELGLAGGLVVDVINGKRVPARQNLLEVAGAVQFFRKTCFDAISPLVPVPEGGWDAITCAMARMNGFKTETLPDLIVEHLKPRNAAFGNAFRRNWQFGIREYVLGNHPLFEAVKCIGRSLEAPVLLGALLRFSAFCWASISRRSRRVPAPVMDYVREEQVSRLRRLISGRANMSSMPKRTVRDSRCRSVLILGASYETGNMGVDALLSGTIAAIMHVHPQAKISLLDYNRKETSRSFQTMAAVKSVRLVNLRFSWNLLLPNHIARLLAVVSIARLLPKRLRILLNSKSRCLQEIEEAEVVASLAGGDSFSDIYGLKRFLYVSLPQVLALAMGKRLILLPQTLGPFRNPVANAVARFILNRAERIYSRGQESLQEMEAPIRYRFSRVRHGYDMAFVLDPRPAPVWFSSSGRAADVARPIVGLNVSGLLYMGGYNRDNMFGLKVCYREVIRAIIQYFVGEAAHIVLFPHVVGHANDPENDFDACRAIHREFTGKSAGLLHCSESRFDHRETKYLIGLCDFFVGSRMHACIAALSQCVPAVALAYSGKFHGVFGTVGCSNCVIDLREHGIKETIDRIDEVFRIRGQQRDSLRGRMASVRESVLGIFKEPFEPDVRKVGASAVV